jgi:DNA-binding NtrC family response regulator
MPQKWGTFSTKCPLRQKLPASGGTSVIQTKVMRTGKDFSLYNNMSTKKKVLIIDDEEDACLLLKGFLAKKNFEVFCSYTLNDGLQQVAKVKPDILFLDNNLPDGFGWEASMSIVAQNPGLEVHLISAYNNSMFDYNKMSKEIRIWQKPISFQKLTEQLCINAS